MSAQRQIGRDLRVVLDAVAQADAPAVLAAAREEARARAQEALAREMTASLLEHARHALQREQHPGAAPTRRAAAPPPERPPTTVRAQQQQSVGEGLYVYGVIACRGGDRPALDLPATESEHLEVVEHAALAALVSRVPLAEFGEESLRRNLNDLAWLESRARRHEDVLERVRAQTTVIPMRLCTIYRSEHALREMLDREAAPMSEALARLEGRTEWGVKLFADVSAVRALAGNAGAEADEDAQDDETGGQAYMERRRRERASRAGADRLIEELCVAAHRDLAAAAVEALLNPLQRREATGHSGEMALNGVYLVADDAVHRFHAAVKAVQQRCPAPAFDVQLTGPWPPYNFVKGSIEAAR